MLYGVGPLEN